MKFLQDKGLNQAHGPGESTRRLGGVSTLHRETPCRDTRASTTDAASDLLQFNSYKSPAS